MLFGILVLGASLRFFMLSEIGLRGDDTLYYLSLCRGWAEPLRENFRPLIIALYALVLRLWDSDWSVKALNASLDSISVLLVFLVSRRLSGRRTAILTALSYALMPRAIAFSRTELLHAASTSALLGSTWFLVAFLTSRSERPRVLLALSGLCLGMSYGIHEDLVLFAPGFAACVLLARIHVGSDRVFDLKGALGDAAVLLGSLLAALSPLGFWGLLARYGSRLGRAPVVGGGGTHAGVSTPELFRNMIEFNTSAPVAFLWFATTLIALALGAHAIWRRRARTGATASRGPTLRPVDYAPTLLVVSYLLLYPYASPKVVFPRLFLPAVPLVMVSLFLWIDRILARIPAPEGPKAVVHILGGLALVLVNFAGYQIHRDMRAKLRPEEQKLYRLFSPIVMPASPLKTFDASSYPISGYRAVANLLEGRVDARSRLLVAPHNISSHEGERRGFRHYFGDDAVYIEDCAGSLRSYIERHSVRYVVFAPFHPKPLRRRPRCLDFGDQAYSAEREAKLLEAYLVANYEVKALARDPRFTLVELRTRPQ